MKLERACFRAGIAAMLIALAACKVQVGAGGGTGGEGGGGGGASTGTPSVPTPPHALWQLAVGGDNTCVVSPHGHVACWGSGETGQLGLGDFQDRSTPVWIPGLDNVVEIALADFAMCALKADESVWCWGMNYYAELGATTAKCPQLGYPCSAVPVKADVSPARHLAAGSHHFCAVNAVGGLECWGDAPNANAAGYHVLDATAGNSHTCARFDPAEGQGTSHNVICFGDNSMGQLGTGDNESGSEAPIVGSVPGGLIEIAAGADFTCGVSGEHRLFCWGQNQFGTLGVGVSENFDVPDTCPGSGACSKHPIEVASAPYVDHVAAHFEQACATIAGGSVLCWGTPSRTSPASASACWAESPECSPTPHVVPGVTGVRTVGVGYGHACAMTAVGHVSCWGLDTHGQLGRGDGPSWSTTAVSVVVPPEPT